MVAHSLFVNTPCCTEVTWNSGAWWSPRLPEVGRGGGGGLQQCAVALWIISRVSASHGTRKGWGGRYICRLCYVQMQNLTFTWPCTGLSGYNIRFVERFCFTHSIFQEYRFLFWITSYIRGDSNFHIISILWLGITNSKFIINDGVYLELYLKIEFVPRSKHCVSATKSIPLMLSTEYTAVCP
jgi:hypothetical protein